MVKISLQTVSSINQNRSEFNSNGEFRSEPTNLVKISHHSKMGVYMSPDLISSSSSATLARGSYLSTSGKHEQSGGNKCIIGLGSGAKINKFQSLLMICILCVSLFFSTCESEEFKETIVKRWTKLRS